MSFSKIILSPFVWLLTAFYHLVGSYGLALILFAVVVKLILFPFAMKGKRSMIQMNLLTAEMTKLQRQYGRDRERYNLEVQKLYEKEHINPMGGCLWSFIPLLVLIPLYAIIRRPLFYIMGLNMEQITQIAHALDWNNVALDMGWIKSVAQEFTSGGYNELFLASLINEENLGALKELVGEGTRLMALNFDFMGVNLSRIPEMKFWMVSGGLGLFILPIISAASGLLFSIISMKTSNVNKQTEEANQNFSNKLMLVFTPAMSLWIGFIMPAALCLYWIANNVLSILQEVISGKMLKKDYEKAAAAREEQLRLAKEEEKAEKRRRAEERARRIEEEKHNKALRKALKEKENENKISGEVKEASRVGLRQYARGRAYDPNRYGNGPTKYMEYKDPRRIAYEENRRKQEEDIAKKQAAAEAKKAKKMEKKKQKHQAGSHTSDKTE